MRTKTPVMFKKLTIVSTIFLISATLTNGQSCGFGCLGFSGGYGGYTIQQYDMKGLNDHLHEIVGAAGYDIGENTFHEGKGFRVGINIFKARFDAVYFGTKFFYQFLEEEKTFVNTNDPSKQRKFNLGFNYWGFGGELGFPLFSYLDLKLVEGGVTLHNVTFKDETYVGDAMFSEVKYESTGTQVGYYVASGLIIHLIKNYISIEGTASYNFIDLEEVQSDNGEIIPARGGIVSLAQKGGLTGTVQFNVSFPL